MRKKNFIAILGFAALLAACAPKGGTSSAASSTVVSSGPTDISVSPSDNTTLSIMIPSGNNEVSMIEKAAAGFSTLYPQIKLDISYINIGSYEMTVRNLAIAKNLPDIIWTNSPEYIFLIQNKVAEPLNGYIEASEKAGDFNFQNDFKVPFFKMGAVNDNYYVVPRSSDQVITFYNKTLLQSANIDVSKIKNGWTWSDFTSICQQWREYADKQGHADWYPADSYVYWDPVYYPIMRSFGADILDNTNGKLSVTVNTPEMKKALESIRSLVTNRYICGGGVSQGSSFDAGTAPFVFQSAAINVYNDKKALHGNIDLATFPLVTGEGTPSTPHIGCGIAGYSMCAASTHKKQAWAFLNYLMSKDGQNALADGGLILPSIRNDLSADPTANWRKDYANLNIDAYLAYDDKKICTDYFLKADTKYMSDLQLAASDLISDTTMAGASAKTIDQVMSDSQDEFEGSLDL